VAGVPAGLGWGPGREMDAQMPAVVCPVGGRPESHPLPQAHRQFRVQKRHQYQRQAPRLQGPGCAGRGVLRGAACKLLPGRRQASEASGGWGRAAWREGTAGWVEGAAEGDGMWGFNI